MKLLLDTHVLIWWLGARDRIPIQMQTALLDTANDVFVSTSCAWEISVKRRIGKLAFNAEFLANFDARVAGLGFTPLAVTAAHMVTGAEIESAHKDPFDRMLAGQARVEGLTVVTADPAFAGFRVAVMWG